MEPNIKSAFNEVFRRLDAMEAKWESKLEEVKSSRLDRDAEVDHRLVALEDSGGGLGRFRPRSSGVLRSWSGTVTSPSTPWSGSRL